MAFGTDRTTVIVTSRSRPASRFEWIWVSCGDGVWVEEGAGPSIAAMKQGGGGLDSAET